MSSLNKACILGNVGNVPEVKSFDGGFEIVSFSVATNEKYKNRHGEQVENVQWHRIVIKNKGLCQIAKNYLGKGDKVYIEGKMETRSWESEGRNKYITEIVLGPYESKLIMVGSKNSHSGDRSRDGGGYGDRVRPLDDMDDEIPY